MRRHRWASQPPPVSPKVMGARMKKMAEQKRMAKGRVVEPEYDPDVPEWARPPPALEGFKTTLVAPDDKPYRIGWLARFFQYVRNEFAQFVSVVSGFSPFQYYAGPYSPWDKNLGYAVEPWGSAGYSPPSLTFSIGREYICSTGSFSILHSFSWMLDENDDDSTYSLLMQIYTEDFYLQSAWQAGGNMSFALRPADLGPEWLDRIDTSVSCQYNYEMDKFHWGIDMQYRGDYSHWSIRYAPQMFNINFYGGLFRGLSAGLEYSYHHKFGVSAWGASGYYEYATHPQDEDGHGTHGWGFAVELNPQGGFHATLAMDRSISIPGQPFYLAAAYSFTYGGDDMVTAWYAGFRTTVPMWINGLLPFSRGEAGVPTDAAMQDLRHNVSRHLEYETMIDKHYENAPAHPTQAVIGWSTNSDGFYGWTMEFNLFSFGDDSEEPHYPVDVTMSLDVGLWTGLITPSLMISSSY